VKALEDLAQKRKIQNQQEIDEITAALEAHQKEKLEELKRDEKAKSDLRVLLMQEGLARELAELDLRRQKELENEELTESEKAVIREKYRQEENAKKDEAAEKEKKRREDELKAEKELRAAQFELGQTAADSLIGLNDLIFEIKKGGLRAGSAEEEAAARKNFEINKKLQIGSASIQGIQGVINALTAPSVIPEPFGSIAKAANAIRVGITTGINIAKIKNSKFGGSSSPSASSGASSSTPSTGSTGAATTPAPNLFGNSTNLNNLNGSNQSQSKPSPTTIKVEAYVAADKMSVEQKIAENIAENASL
jgi:hypothetical protein